VHRFGIGVAAVLGSLSFSLSQGCAPLSVSLRPGTRTYTPSDYTRIFESWTRSARVTSLDELDTMLAVTATLEAWDFRSAYIAKFASDYRLTPEQRREMLDKALSESQSGHRFYVALAARTARSADLTRADATWVARLIDDQGHETAPSSIERVTRPGPIETMYFPYTSPWRSVFRITFPITSVDGRPAIAANSRWVSLRFAGVEGSGDLRWALSSR